MDHLGKQARLSIKVQQGLIERSKQGTWAHPLCMVLILLTTSLFHRAPILTIFFIACISALTPIRIFVLHPGFLRNSLSEATRRRLHIYVLFACSAVWGIVPGVALWVFGYQDKDVLILLLYQAVIAFGTLNLFVHDRRLVAIALFLLFAQPIVGSILHHGPAPFEYPAAAAAYLLYCLVQSKKLNALYASQISDNYDLSVAAYQDCLTGLPNRLYMNEALETCLEKARSRRMQVALLYIDLDGFKQINDQHSHRVGDLFLCEAAARIRRSLREHDVAARIGGDEFTILLSDCNSEQEALGLAQRVLRDTQVPVLVNGKELLYSASIGISLFPLAADNPDMLMRTADEAMYAAKAQGKNRICLHRPVDELDASHIDIHATALGFA